ncbi:MAG: AraC family transcriptional regulator [Alphaproteobacteria bacterium]|nr:AraC family transcriptional regulator [Alphaproteobacteria bacterium]
MTRLVDQETAYRQSAGKASEAATFWRLSAHDGLECLKARFRNHRYAPHAHETYAIGVISNGVERFRYRGVEHTAPAGTFAVVEPGELHDGTPGDGGYRYKMTYPSRALMATIAEEIWDKADVQPYFGTPVMDDPLLFSLFDRLHDGVAPDCDLSIGEGFTTDSRLVETYGLMIARHGKALPAPPGIGREAGPVARACAMLLDHMAEPPGLEAIARAVGLSRFRLIRAFRRELGLPPQAWLQSQRVAQAKDMIRNGQELAQVAAATGFSDQPHLTRVFKSHIGVTPAVYRAGL